MKKLVFLFLLISCFFGYGQYTLIPDVNFEKSLISQRIDSGVPDGSVLTANAKKATSIRVNGSQIRDLTGIQDFENILTLACRANLLTELDLSKNTLLQQLFCDDNKLTKLDLPNNKNLEFLNCGGNLLSNLDLSQQPSLTTLYCDVNQLKILDISKNSELVLLYCVSNQLLNLDITKNLKLRYISCSNNPVDNLDLSNNKNLEGLVSANTLLKNINLKNGNNLKITIVDLRNNPHLNCIQVDNKSYSDTNWYSKKDATAIYSDDCDNKTPAPIAPPTITATGNQTYCPGTSLKIVETISITPDPAEPTTDAVFIQISSGYISGQDFLTLTGIHPNVSSNWSQLEGKLNLYSTTGNKIPYSEFEDAIKDVTFDSNSTTASGTRTFSISLGTGSLSYLPSNGHYYEYVAAPGINWTKAKNDASVRKYYGLEGYLATLTTVEEAQLAGAQSPGAGWIGGSDAEKEGDWKWVTGLEAGTTFWVGKSNGTITSPLYFANWNSPLEPNDSNNNEDYAHITSAAVGNIGTWNDLSEQGDPPGNYYPNGFIVEYGGMQGDPVLQISASTSLTVGKIEIVSSGSSICDSGTVTFKASANGSPINWYDSLTGGNLVGTGTDFTTPILTSNKSYFADVGCALIPRIEFKAVINASPTINSTTIPKSICTSGSVTLEAVASAGIINWYNAPTGGSLLGTGTSFPTPNITSPTTFYAGALNNGCTSAVRVPVKVNVYQPPSVSDEEIVKCKLIDEELDAGLSGMNYLWSTGEQTQKISVATAGIYTVDVTSLAPENCTSTQKSQLNLR